ncbi:MAG: BUG/TctC family periplasmic protein, partial [uncultured Acetobacteraceae bacterium]
VHLHRGAHRCAAAARPLAVRSGGRLGADLLRGRGLRRGRGRAGAARVGPRRLGRVGAAAAGRAELGVRVRRHLHGFPQPRAPPRPGHELRVLPHARPRLGRPGRRAPGRGRHALGDGAAAGRRGPDARARGRQPRALARGARRAHRRRGGLPRDDLRRRAGLLRAERHAGRPARADRRRRARGRRRARVPGPAARPGDDRPRRHAGRVRRGRGREPVALGRSGARPRGQAGAV